MSKLRNTEEGPSAGETPDQWAGEAMTTAELNRNMSAALERVGGGAAIEITRYGKVVANLVPPDYRKNIRPQPERDPDDSGAEDDDEPFGIAETKPVDPPAKKTVTKKAEVRESPAPVVSAPKMTASGETREEKLERLAVMEAARKEMGIKERPSPWDMKYGKQKKTTH